MIIMGVDPGVARLGYAFIEIKKKGGKLKAIDYGCIKTSPDFLTGERLKIINNELNKLIKKYKPDMLIDLATLTGACVMALGEKIAGIFSLDDNLATSIVKAGEKTHERCWRLPLPDDYKELIKSDFADIKNLSSSKWGGAITAALFLSEFTGDTRWAHIDIAGPAYAKKKNAYCGAGGTGFGVRLLCELLK